MVNIYPIDPECPRVGTARAFIMENRDGRTTVREAMEEFVYRHTALCARCMAYNAAKGPVDG